ncbi:MAG TPA: hypothetical protein IGS40_27190 [Trichormus sp. M33_DOE_039]|nr:hypothetical protein [Trichormus sp. M33_DOE_039]
MVEFLPLLLRNCSTWGEVRAEENSALNFGGKVQDRIAPLHPYIPTHGSLLMPRNPSGFTNAAYAGKPFRQLLMGETPISNCRRSCVANAALTTPQVVHRPRNCLPYIPTPSPQNQNLDF